MLLMRDFIFLFFFFEFWDLAASFYADSCKGTCSYLHESLQLSAQGSAAVCFGASHGSRLLCVCGYLILAANSGETELSRLWHTSAAKLMP